MPDVVEFVAQGQILGGVGLALDKDTQIDVLGSLNLEDLDALLVMTIKAGLSGQEFMPELLEKVRKLRERARFTPIGVDGGINNETIVEAQKAGATRFISTSHLFGSQNPPEAFHALDSIVDNT